jgi:[glutamine synthetase] adenylyltransferase / [glutamine synthetase]-adenylyl-L-tyrosine phosphorylase
MPIHADTILSLAPDVDPRLAAEHLARLDARYFERFTAEEVARHAAAISSLSTDRPAAVLVDPVGRSVKVTVAAFDHAGAFAALAGILSSLGFNIEGGDIFTWSRPAAESPRELHLRRRRIIDTFTGTVHPSKWDEAWPSLAADRVRAVFALFERGGDSVREARQLVNEMAAGALGELAEAGSAAVLYPVRIEMASAPAGRTRMRVLSQDTPFFLFAFSTALTLQGVSIEHVTIRTEEDRIQDEFEFVDTAGQAVTDPAVIDRIKLSVLLTKQFTSFLPSAPDPLAALVRFEQLVREVSATGEGRWVQLLADQEVQRDLAQILGASTFLWEDFVRLQYEELLPMLSPHIGGRIRVEPMETVRQRLDAAVGGASDPEEFARRLNEFKDREIYLYDLDHILGARRDPGPGATPDEAFETDFLLLSRRLTALAEAVVDAAVSFAIRTLSARFGEPRTVAGLAVRHAILGLGKLGGVALGYASDIELLVVYSDSGSTAGPEVIGNAEFYDKAVRELLQLVHARREGIFHVDLRLRPYAAAGPLAASLESFCTYYERGGPAHSYERLSLVRLRAVGGDPDFRAQVERLRDEMVYTAESIDLVELRELRARQVREKTSPPKGGVSGGAGLWGAPAAGSLNAKFSPGALVDLEYAVQILQVMHGATERRLRTPRIHEALHTLASIGVVEESEARDLVAAYRFFRRLINGLRMLRGSAQDLVLPGLESHEYVHLARRMGYASEPGSSPARRLHLDFEAHTAAVRAFVQRHFGRDSIPGAAVVTVADLVLSDEVPEGPAYRLLTERGFADPARALGNLRRIGGENRALFARLAVLACDVLARRPDPDMALNNWERYLHALSDPPAHLRQILSQPMRLEILLSIFSASQFLADTLVREPSLLEAIGRPEVIHARRSSADVAEELRRVSGQTPDLDAWRDALRRFRRREILRIAARDICLGVPTPRIMEEISDLADGVIAAALERRLADAPGAGQAALPAMCIVAFGKLGGRELNYSSDIDLLGVCAGKDGTDPVEPATRLLEQLRGDLSSHTTEGYAYRVDLRLRPYGSSGELSFTLPSLESYYDKHAAQWELQALLKARPVAGDPGLGMAFLQLAHRRLLTPRKLSEVASEIDSLRREAIRALSRSVLSTTDIKTGLGGLRDVEFLAQGLQLAHAFEHPALICGGTLPALAALAEAGILPAETAEMLSRDYVFLRRVEHFLQIYEDRQTHSLPRNPAQLRALARLMLGSGATSEQLLADLGERFQRVRSRYEELLTR